MKVGFIGLGAMGLPMTRNLLAKGHEVVVASRSRPPVDAAVAAGASDGGDAGSVAAASEITFLCVPSSPDVRDVVGRMLRALGPGKTVVDCSTIDPDVERAQHDRVAATGAGYLEAPLTGGTVGAEAGTLTVMVGGDAGTLERARPAIEAFASLIVHVGGPGAAQVVKLANNLICAAAMLATAEAFAMCAKAGVDLALARHVISNGTGDCFPVRTRVPFEGVIPDGPPSNGWRPGFTTDLLAKDLDLALDYGGRNGSPLFTTALAREFLGIASAHGYGSEDYSAVGKVIRQLAGV